MRDLEREPAHRGHALGHEQLLLRGLQTAQQALHLAARPALAVGDDADDHRGQAEEHHEERDAGPADPRRRQGGRGRHEAAGGERSHEGDPRSEVVRIDRHEREEEQVEEALAAAGQQHQDEDEEQVDGQRAEEDGARGARLHGDQREDAELVEGEPDDEGEEVDALARPERNEAERGEAADHRDREQDGEHPLIALQQPEDRVPGLALRRHRRHPRRL